MAKVHKSFSRREFIRIAGALGASSMLSPPAQAATSKKLLSELTAPLIVPVRPFGRTGVKVSMLGLGGSLNLMRRQRLLQQAFKMGVTYWDTAESYSGGGSEEAIGKYFLKHPENRKKIFLVTKSDSNNPRGLTDSLNLSLKRMNTSYIDLYFLHSVHSADELDSQVRRWAEKKKSEGKIRFFGFSSHSNMEACMMGASRLGWIDGIMITYNYRLMHTEGMKAAVDACVEAGIGLTAMKTQGGWSWNPLSKIDKIAKKLKEQFIQRGFTEEQARLKAVWENSHIASICSEMPNVKILVSNVAASLDRTKLSTYEWKLLDRYAYETAPGYCAGCAHICKSAVNGAVPIADIMRYLMYSRCYGDRERAKCLFRSLPLSTRRRIGRMDYSLAELRCPQKMAIGSLMLEAVAEFS